MKIIESNLEEIENLLYINKSLLELINGYCQYYSESIDEIYNLLEILKSMINNQDELQERIENISLEIYRTKLN